MNKPEQKCIVLIDGSNFYFKLRDLGLKNLLDFDFQSFIKDLSGKYKCIEAVYFIGKIRTDGSKKSNYLLSQQQKLLQHLSNNKINYKLGYLLKYKDNIYHEKGVDVNIATYILVTAYENLADKVILISSDTDLMPAIIKAIQKNKIIEYIGFKHNPSRRMISDCSRFRLFSKSELIKYIKQIKKSHKQP